MSRPSRLLGVLACVYVALIPLGWSPFPANVQWADVALLGVLGAALAQLRTVQGSPLRSLAGGGAKQGQALDRLVGLYLIGSTASLLTTTDPRQTALELVKQDSLAAVYLVISRLCRDGRLRQRLVAWAAASAAAVAGISLLAWKGARWFGWWIDSPLLEPWAVPGLGAVLRLKGPLHSPGLLCNYLTFAWPLLLGLALQQRRHRVAWGLGAAAVLAAGWLTATYSLIGLIGAGLVVAWPLWARAPRLAPLRAAVIAAWVAGFLVLNAALAVYVYDARWTTGYDRTRAASPYIYTFHEAGKGARTATLSVSYDWMSYGLLKRTAMEAFLRRPWTGVGAGTFQRETERAYQAGALHAPYRRMDPHSEWCGRLAETGLIGLGSLLLLWAGILRAVGRVRRAAGRTSWLPRAVIAGLLGLLVNSVNVDIMNFRFLWVGLGWLRTWDEGAA